MIRALFVALVVVVAAIGAAPTASADPENQLRGMLPAGYGPDSCQPADNPPVHGEPLAALECWNNSMPGGPTYAYYSLHTNHDMLNDAFWNERNGSRQAYAWFEPCPGWQGSGPPAPATWHHDGTPEQIAGWIVCGHVYGPVHGDPNAKAVMWTRDSDLLLSVAEGPDLAGLYDWWKQNR